MPRRYAHFRWIVGTVLLLLLLALAAVQLASEALASGAAAPATLPRRLPRSFGLSVYRALDRIAPAPYVETTLSQDALRHGDPERAAGYAVKLPASPVRDELFAQIAAARGEAALAVEYALAAPDPERVTAIAQQVAADHPERAYALEGLLEVRLARTGTHPDAVAAADWEMGRFANREAWRQVPGSVAQHAWLQRALLDFERAANVAPLSERYVVEAANQADLLGERAGARALFAHAAEMDPASADAIAGLGVVAWQEGDRATALAELQRARALDSDSAMVRALERDLR